MPIHGYPGGVITANPVAPTSTVATGVWTTEQQLQAIAAGNWPRPGPPQPISRSLRFNSADSAYLNRTLTTPTNNKIFTFSAWVKRSALGAAQTLFDAFVPATSFDTFRFNSSDQLDYFDNTAGYLTSTQVFRDVGAWYHVMAAVDTTQATSSNRVKLYVNGTQITAFSATAYPSQNQAIIFNSAVAHNIGRFGYSANAYLSGYLTEVNFIDGQALTPSSFGQTNASTGVWEPIPYTGTYGNNGFYLNFSDNSGTTSTTLGKDSSGNGNNWTPNNFSVTAGAGNDSLVDSPTSYGTDTGAGGEVRGNYATLNPLAVTYGTSFSNGNLKVLMNGANTSIPTSTIAVSSGKWYAEMLVESTNAGTRTYPLFGICNPRTFGDPAFLGDTADEYSYSCDGYKTNNNVATNVGTTLTTNDIMMLAFDADSGKIWWGKNGTWIASGDPATGANAMYSSIPSSTYVLALCGYTSTNATVNFGQRAFAYTAPSGFKALCTQNLPTPTIGATSTTQANDYFNVVTFSGNGSAGSVTGVGFQPDFIWAKNRTNAYNHELWDAIRGVNSTLFSNSTAAQDTTANRLVSFNSDGFSYGTSSNLYVNATNSVAWNWKANGAGSSNTAGTITSTVSASTTSGFSVVTFTGAGAATIGHGLGVAPSMVIMKARNEGTAPWAVYHASIGAGNYLALNSTAASTAATTIWNSTAPTSTVFSIGSGWSTFNYVAYCFAPVAGYSAFGSYTGNGSADGPFVYLGFRPEFVMIKRTSAADNWVILDAARSTANPTDEYLWANLSSAEVANLHAFDFLSNGFKIRNSTSDHNTNGSTYIYACFAESPFKYALAR